MEKSWITTCTRLAAYLGMTADGIRRITKDEELLLHLVRCNAREAGADWRRECAKYKARLRHPAGRGCADVWMFFRAFAPDLADDAEELRRAVAGQPTWMKAADAEREYRVSARTLSQKTALGDFELGGLSFIRVRRTLLVRREEIESRWPRRDRLMLAGRGISLKCEHPDSNGPRTGAYAAADATTSGMTMTDSAPGNLRGSGAVRAANQFGRGRIADFARNSARGLPAGADAGCASVVNEGR